MKPIKGVDRVVVQDKSVEVDDSVDEVLSDGQRASEEVASRIFDNMTNDKIIHADFDNDFPDVCLDLTNYIDDFLEEEKKES